LAQDAIGRIERHDKKINAICVRDFERGLAAARAADAALARGERKPLLGIPLTVKESYNVAGLPTTWGIPQQKDFVPAEDALPITRVKDAGGVILGKTNVPSGSATGKANNDIYGITNNPYDLGRTPGGSSGGSAAALAAGYGPLSLGSTSAARCAFRHFIAASTRTSDLCTGAVARTHAAGISADPDRSRHGGDWSDGARRGDLSLLLDVMRVPIRWKPARLTGSRCRRPAITT